MALVLGRGKLAKIEVALSNREDTGCSSSVSKCARIVPRGLDTRAAKFVSRLSEFQIKQQMLQWESTRCGLKRGTEGGGGKGAPAPCGRELAGWRKGGRIGGRPDAGSAEAGMDKFFQWAAGQPRHLARVGARLPHLARGNEVLALDYQSRPGGDPKTWDGSAACGYVDSETAQAMVTVAGVSRKGRRLGRWLAWEEARTLLKTADPHSIRGMRDRALLAVLVACALRRGELSRMNCEHLALRDGRWVFWISWEREIRRDRWRCRCGWSKQSMGGSRRRELRTSAAAAGQVCLCVVHSVAEGSLGW